jgi:hypothetical protein
MVERAIRAQAASAVHGPGECCTTDQPTLT